MSDRHRHGRPSAPAVLAVGTTTSAVPLPAPATVSPPRRLHRKKVPPSAVSLPAVRPAPPAVTPKPPRKRHRKKPPPRPSARKQPSAIPGHGYLPGVSGNPKGRPPAELDLLRAQYPKGGAELFAGLEAVRVAPKTHPKLRVQVTQFLIERLFGRARTPVEVEAGARLVDLLAAVATRVEAPAVVAAVGEPSDDSGERR
jgi:hypothetical protein